MLKYSEWVWSAQHQQHYRFAYDANGNPQYQWSGPATPPNNPPAYSHQQTPAKDASIASSKSSVTPSPYATSSGAQQYEYSQNVSSLQGYGKSQAAATEDYVPDEEKARVSGYIFPASGTFAHGHLGGDDEGKGIAGYATVPRSLEARSEIRGRPESGYVETLDPSYFVRSDARRFFSRGRVFSILFTEDMGDITPKTDSDNVSVVKYGETVYSQIRRFVAVREKNGFCLACPIFTYQNRGTTKPGCQPSEHAIIYAEGLQLPVLLQGETGITKRPIGLLSESKVPMNVASRIWFGKVYPIDWNVKVKDLGRVRDEDMDVFTHYCLQEGIR